MTSATVTAKGQITVPAAVRKALHIEAGDRIEFVEVAEGKFEILAASKDAKQLKGMISTNKKISIEQMNQAIKKKQKP
ncbi:MAG: AbrB/MazE/SpoVT family DNA-binding domain-containing protein [Cellvibrionales bacterium]|nr:AbrB/MazE/SpoVT family DNA-binding domain-containing protein [Cellvibrionales bacterium]